MPPMESQGWRKKSTVTVLYSYSYPASSGSNDGKEVSMSEGERLILLEKSNQDWWQVRRPGDKSQPFYAPANYLQEDGLSKAKKAAASVTAAGAAGHHNAKLLSSDDKSNRRHVDATTSLATSAHLMRSDDCLQIAPRKSSDKLSMKAANSELRKQRSTSMDAIMFLELLENEIRDMPTAGIGGSLKNKGGHSDVHNRSSSSNINRQMKSESLVDRFKKPRISKDLWERRKSWAVEELAPAPPLLLAHSSRHPPLKEETANINAKRRSMQSLLSSSTAVAPPLPPRLSTSVHESQPKRDKTIRDDDPPADSDKKNDKAPALPPKKNSNQGAVAGTPTPKRMGENYSRVIPIRSSTATGSGASAGTSVMKVNAVPDNGTEASQSSSVSQSPNLRLSDSLEKLAQQIQTPLSYPHPIPPPRRSSADQMERSGSSSASPPQLPPKISITKVSMAKSPHTAVKCVYFRFEFF